MNRDLRILMLEDTPADALLMERALRDGGIAFSARRVETREEFVHGLTEFKPDVILADHELPAFDGLAALKIARERLRDTPVIMVTGKLGDELAVNLLREGACDHVLKDHLARLASAVRRAMEEVRAECERREAGRELAAQLDELRRFQRVTVDRELRMKEIKEENESLREENRRLREENRKLTERVSDRGKGQP